MMHEFEFYNGKPIHKGTPIRPVKAWTNAITWLRAHDDPDAPRRAKQHYYIDEEEIDEEFQNAKDFQNAARAVRPEGFEHLMINYGDGWELHRRMIWIKWDAPQHFSFPRDIQRYTSWMICSVRFESDAQLLQFKLAAPWTFEDDYSNS